PCHGGGFQSHRRRFARYLRPEAARQMSVIPARTIVDISGLTLDFPTYRGRVHALSDVTLAVREGEITGLVGESGCGKSVASMSIIRLLPPGSTEVMSGTIRLRGHDISRA